MKVIISKQDLAGQNIKDHLERSGFKDIIEVEEDIIFAKVDLKEDLIFASRHKSESEIPTLTVHTTGIFNEDTTYGGKAFTLSQANPSKMRIAIEELMKLKKEMNLSHEVCLEVTHHGPCLDTPMFFIEIGSNKDEWIKPENGDVITKAILNTIKRQDKFINVIGFGGPHYAKRFTEKMLKTNYAFGHICPKYMIASLTEDLIKQMIEKSNAKKAIIEKDCKRKDFIKQVLDKLGVEWEKW